MRSADTTTRPSLTREAVISATRDLIEHERLDAVSLRRVGAALGVTAPALYAYVTDKRDLLRGVAEHEFAELIDRFETIDDPDPVQRLRRSSRVYIEYALENPELFKTMFLFPPDLSLAAATGEELPSATRAFELSLAAVGEAIAQGAFRADLDPVMVGLSMWTATHGCATVLLLGFALDDDTRDALITNVVDTMIAGFAA